MRTAVQDFRTLLVGLSTVIGGKRQPHLLGYYAEHTRIVQKGSASNAGAREALACINDHRVQVDHMYLNHTLCFVVDCTHACICDYMNRRFAQDRNDQVCPL